MRDSAQPGKGALRLRAPFLEAGAWAIYLLGGDTMTQKRNKQAAVVRCTGGYHREPSLDLAGFTGDCKSIKDKYPQGIASCQWGCLGMGSCVAACPRGAIRIGEKGSAVVERGKCVGCGLCVKACPQGLIRLTPVSHSIEVSCMSRDTGAQTRTSCDSGCIACGICVKNCPVSAIHMEENHAVIDHEICIACGMCAVKCPRNAIRDSDGIFTVNL